MDQPGRCKDCRWWGWPAHNSNTIASIPDDEGRQMCWGTFKEMRVPQFDGLIDDGERWTIPEFGCINFVSRVATTIGASPETSSPAKV